MHLPAGYRVSVEREPSFEDRRALSDALGAYNEPFLPKAEAQSLAVLVRGPGGELRAGLDGVHLCRLAVHPLSLGPCRAAPQRRRPPTDGRSRAAGAGCSAAIPPGSTPFSFQAPDFYAKLGYRRIRPARLSARPSAHFPEKTAGCGMSVMTMLLRRLVPLRRGAFLARQPHPLPLPALLLLDLPQERRRRRVCDQHHGRRRHAEGAGPPRDPRLARDDRRRRKARRAAFLPALRHAAVGQRRAMAGAGPPVCLGDRHDAARAAGQRAPAVARQGGLGRAAGRARRRVL